MEIPFRGIDTLPKATRRMKNTTPVVRPNGNDSDSDEAPDVVTKQIATENVLTQRRQEKEARAQANASKRCVSMGFEVFASFEAEGGIAIAWRCADMIEYVSKMMGKLSVGLCLKQKEEN